MIEQWKKVLGGSVTHADRWSAMLLPAHTNSQQLTLKSDKPLSHYYYFNANELQQGNMLPLMYIFLSLMTMYGNRAF